MNRLAAALYNDFESDDEVTQVCVVKLPPSDSLVLPYEDAEPTVVSPPPVPDPEVTVITRMPVDPRVASNNVAPSPPAPWETATPDEQTVIAELPPFARGNPEHLRQLFAEPPRPANRQPAAKQPDTPEAKRRRRRRLLLAFSFLAGAWVTLGPWINKPPTTSGTLRSVTAAFAPKQVQPRIALPPPDGRLGVASASAHLEADRYEQALVHYRDHAKRAPDEEVYAVIVDVVTRRIVDQCREQENSICQW